MRLITFLLRQSRRTVGLAILAGLLSGIGSTALIAMINAALADPARLTRLAGWYAGACLAVFATKAIAQILLVRLAQDSFYELRVYLSRAILNTPLRRLERLGPHRLLATLTDDVQTITDSILGIPYLCINGAILLACLVYLVALSWQVFGLVIIALILGILSYRRAIQPALGRFKRARAAQNTMFGSFRALIEGARQMQLHRPRRVDFLARQLEPAAADFRQHERAGMTIYSVAGSWGQLLYFVLIGLVLFVMPLIKPVAPPVLVGYVLIVLSMMSPIEVIIGWLPHLGRANVALKTVEQLGLDLRDARDLPVPAPPATGVLTLSGVRYAYGADDDRSFTLGPVDLQLAPGEIVFVIGGNGGGKSTLAMLVAGLYPPDQGRIDYAGVTIDDDRREWYRQHIAAVFGEFYLFAQLHGLRADGLEARAQTYLRAFGLDHVVRLTDGAFSTVDLSQGQRKRLALITAYLEDRPIYLFDEWAADQDPIFKAVFYRELLPDLKRRGKAVLVISHDDRYFDAADRILKVDDGALRPEPLAAAGASLSEVA